MIVDSHVMRAAGRRGAGAPPAEARLNPEGERMATHGLTRRTFLAGTTLAGLATVTPRGMLAAPPAWAAAGARVGDAAPGFTVAATTGQSLSLADQRGKLVILEWTNHDCPYVRKHYETGNMQALQRETTAQGVIWLTLISSSPGTQGYVTPKQADELTTTRKASPTSVLLDPTGVVGKAYGATNTPHMYLIDNNGLLVYAGAIDDRPTTRRADVRGARNYVRAALEDVAAGRQVQTPATRAYGCTVKYA
jgi:peroxiredoxin